MQISANIHAIKIPFKIQVTPETTLERFVYSYVLGSDKLCLLDSGVDGAEKVIFEALKKRGKKYKNIESLLLTHAHPDHIGAAHAIQKMCNCDVLAHANARPWVEDIEKQFADRPVPGFHTLVGGSVTIDRVVNDNEIIDVGETALQVIHTPGHSTCSISLLCKKSGVLFSGDAIPAGNDLPIYEDVDLAVESIKRLKNISGVKCLLSSWSDPCLGHDPYDTMENGLHYFQRIHTIICTLSKREAIDDPMRLCRLVIQEMGLPELAVNPLVARSLYSHKKLIGTALL